MPMFSHRKRILILVVVALLLCGAEHPRAESVAIPSSEKSSRGVAVETLRRSVSNPIGVVRRDDRSMLISGGLGSYGEPGEKAARTFLAGHPGLFGTSGDHASLSLVRQRTNAGFTHLVFQQWHEGVKVHDAEIVFNFDPDGALSFVGGRFEPHVDVATIPQLTASEAVQVLRQWIGTLGRSPRTHGNYLRDDLAPLLTELVVYAHPEESPRLTYHILQPTRTAGGNAAETYEGFVDAQTGDLVGTPTDANRYREGIGAAFDGEFSNDAARESLAVAATPRGRIFKNGNPIAGTGDTSLTDASVIPDTAYVNVALPRLTQNTGLVGQYADCWTRTAENYRAKPDLNGNYLFKRSKNLAVGARFDAVMAYYFVDFAQDYVYRTLSVKNAAHRSIEINVNGTTSENSSYTGGAPDAGYITMGSGGVDDSEDAEVVLHEYGHALLDGLRYAVWGGAGVKGTYAGTGAIGEGFSDYFAASITSQFFHQADTPFEMQFGEWDATAYSPSKWRVLNSTDMYPAGLSGEGHHDGQIWSSALWRIRELLGARKADKLFLLGTDGIVKQTSHFPDAATFILHRAAKDGYGKNLQNKIRQIFEAKGILPKIAVTMPAAGTTWAAGSTQTIRWSYKGGDLGGQALDSVKIELLKNGVVNSILADSVSAGTNDRGTFSWTIPGDMEAGSTYQVRVSSLNYDVVTRDSAQFSIVGRRVVITPANKSITVGQRLQLTAKTYIGDSQVVPTVNSDYTWTPADMVGANGLFTASNIAGTVTVKAELKAYPGVSGTTTVVVKEDSTGYCADVHDMLQGKWYRHSEAMTYMYDSVSFASADDGYPEGYFTAVSDGTSSKYIYMIDDTCTAFMLFKDLGGGQYQLYRTYNFEIKPSVLELEIWGNVGIYGKSGSSGNMP